MSFWNQLVDRFRADTGKGIDWEALLIEADLGVELATGWVKELKDQGIRIEDHQGKSYIDAFAGLYCVNIGYGRTEVADAIYEQAKKLAYYHTYVGHSTDTIIELSSRIIDWAPAGMKKVYYGMSGSDANETQIKLVWYYNNVKGRPNKKKIISRRWARSTMACSRI